MKISLKLTAALLASATFAAFTTAQISAQEAPAAKEATSKPLTMGDPAPPFKVTDWYKGEAVELDDKGTFIVECWATWCGPCIAVFPHLSEIAKANEGKITVIGVNVWERKKPEEVKEFVKNQGDKMSYLVAADGEKVIADQWLKAAGQNGIPSAFVINKGVIAWIGHPARLKQDLLDSIIAGTYDVAAAVAAKEKEEAAGKFFNTNVTPLLRQKDYAGAIEKLEEMKKQFPDNEAMINSRIEMLQKMVKQPAP